MVYNKVIFLDVDGVLDSLPYFKSQLYKLLVKKTGKADMSNMLNRYNLFWVGLLCKITRAKVVMSSTWRFGWNEDGTVKEEVQGHEMHKTDKLLKRFGINLFSITRRGELRLNKNHEINEPAMDEWCHRKTFSGMESVKEQETVLTYGRGTQIFEWLERNNFHGKFIILDDDISDIIIYKDLATRIVHTSYYKGWGGFGFRHFMKAILFFIKQRKIAV